MNAPFKKKLTVPGGQRYSDPLEPYVMKVADDLSNDPVIAAFLGPRFKVIVDYDAHARRITYSFRSPDDAGLDEHNARPV